MGLPSFADWQDKADVLELKREGAELSGPCPVCGGVDRFHVGRNREGGAKVGCRGCMDGQPDDARRKAFGVVLREAFPERGRGERGGNGNRKPPLRQTPRKRACRRSDAMAVEDAERLWAGAVAAEGTPAMDYLELRGVNPWRIPDGSEPCGWLPAGKALELLDHAKAGTPPEGCAGVLVWPWTDAAGAVLAVQCEGLDGRGRRCDPRWRRTVGRMEAAFFRCGWTDSQRTVIVEGPMDAVAVATVDGVDAYAVGGSQWASKADDLAALGRHIVLMPDGDEAGDSAFDRLWPALKTRGVDYSVRRCARDSDPASELLNGEPR